MTRVELGGFAVFATLMSAALVAFVFTCVDVWICERLQGKPQGPRRFPTGALLRIPLHLAVGMVMTLSILGLGDPVGGRIAFDEAGMPQRATLQVVVASGGKARIEHVMLRAFGPDGETRALHRTGFASQRKPLPASPAFWDGDRVRSLETLEVVASFDAVRSSMPALAGTESRLLRARGDEAVFQRRDGVEVRVSAHEVVAGEQLSPPGCLLDLGGIRKQDVPGLIEPTRVPWPSAGPGCPSAAPADTALYRSFDAAFGDVSVLLTLREGDETRWQRALPEIAQTEEPVLLGAFPARDALCVVNADDDALVFSRLQWSDGSTIDVTRWE